jgi:hypothetical protein
VEKTLWLPNREETSYRRGYRNGRTDKLLGQRSEIAVTSPDAEYARGYLTGQAGEEPIRFTIDAELDFSTAHEDTHVRVSIHMGFALLEEAEFAAARLREHYFGRNFTVVEVQRETS